MQPDLIVIALDEGKQLGLGIGEVAPCGGIWSLEFEGGEEALRDGVVPAVALAAHALESTGGGQERPEARRCEFRASVRVKDQPRLRRPPCKRTTKRLAGNAAAGGGASSDGGIWGHVGAIVSTIFGTNVRRGRLSTGQLIARNVTRSVTDKVVGGVVADIGKSVGGQLGGSIGRSLVRGALGGLLRR